MATAGIFTLITNDGKQDRMLMATSMLHSRLHRIKQHRAHYNQDPTPTLLDIEKTHILFTNAHFKPFAAIGYEYGKVRPQSGNPALGSSLQFSIPQFGDFFHDMALHVVLQQPTMTVTATLPGDQPAMRWAHFPGERLLKKVAFEVNGNPLDEYTSAATNFHREFRVSDSKLSGWKRCVGQEEALSGYVRQPDWALSGVAPEAHRLVQQVAVGNQTPSAQKTPQLEMFIPLNFWFNKDVRLAVPSVAIPYGMRFINVDLASREELVDMYPRGASTFAAPGGTMGAVTVATIELYINNLFVNPEVHDIYIRRIGFSLIRVHRQQTYNATKNSDDVHLQNLKWPIEFLFVGMKVKDYHNNSTADVRREHLDKWHTWHQVQRNSYTTSGSLSARDLDLTQNGGAVSVAVAGAGTQLDGTNTDFSTDFAVGDVFRLKGQLYTVATITNATTLDVVAEKPFAAAVAASTDIKKVELRGVEVRADVCVPTLDKVTLRAHGIPIYNGFPASFYNAYTPYHYGGPNIRTPKDCGALMVPFCLYPGTYQPSGHLNISRAREFFLEYTSSVISSSVNGTLIVLASALNFLLISDGSAVLRYST